MSDNEKKHFSIDDPQNPSLIKKINQTLVRKFMAAGYDYEKFKFDSFLSYREIEKVLIDFQTGFTVFN